MFGLSPTSQKFKVSNRLHLNTFHLYSYFFINLKLARMHHNLPGEGICLLTALESTPNNMFRYVYIGRVMINIVFIKYVNCQIIYRYSSITVFFILGYTRWYQGVSKRKKIEGIKCKISFI